MNRTILSISLFISSFIYSQNAFENRDKDYTYRDARKIIQGETEYAKEVEKDTTQGHYYVAMEKFRFLAEFTGNERKIESDVFNSMIRVLKIKTGNSDILNELVSREYEFDIGNSKIWMPIQDQLLEPFKSEVKKGEKVLLYCLFTNEHKFDGGIINTFLISEFLTEWE
jgi:hypothetical protein